MSNGSFPSSILSRFSSAASSQRVTVTGTVTNIAYELHRSVPADRCWFAVSTIVIFQVELHFFDLFLVLNRFKYNCLLLFGMILWVTWWKLKDGVSHTRTWRSCGKRSARRLKVARFSWRMMVQSMRRMRPMGPASTQWTKPGDGKKTFSLRTKNGRRILRPVGSYPFQTWNGEWRIQFNGICCRKDVICLHMFRVTVKSSNQEQYIKPVTLQAGKVSWALMQHPDGLDCDLFISHAWQEGARCWKLVVCCMSWFWWPGSFAISYLFFSGPNGVLGVHEKSLRINQCLQGYSAYHWGVFEFLSKVTYSWPWGLRTAWCCMLANPQNLNISSFLESPTSSPFAVALRASKVMLVVPNRHQSVYTRLWCLMQSHRFLVFTRKLAWTRCHNTR